MPNDGSTTNGPLAGQRIVITRMSQQGGRLRRLVRELGGIDVSVPLIALADPTDGGVALEAAVTAMDGHDWVVITSPNGADAFYVAIMNARGLDLTIEAEILNAAQSAGTAVRSIDVAPRVAAIGPGTADRLRSHGIDVEFVPNRSVGEGLVEEFPAPDRPGASVLVIQAEAARPVVGDGLAAAGYVVERVGAYRTVEAEVSDGQRALIFDADVITFTSSSTVEQFCELVGPSYLPPRVVSIGPITSETARNNGMTVSAEADPHTIDGLLEALIAIADADEGRSR